MSSSARVLCTCSQCIKHSTTSNNKTVQGRLINKATRSEHRNRDASQPPVQDFPASSSPSAARGSKRPPPSPASGSATRPAKKPRTDDPPEALHRAGTDLSPRVILLIFLLMAWLHLCCGLSQDNAHALALLLQLILREALNNARLQLHRDVRTAMNTLSLEPAILRSVCCPKCFAKYPLDAIPDFCTRRESPKSRPCRERLTMTRHTAAGPKRVPRRLYSTQSFESWLTWFLSRSGIKDLIDKSYEHSPAPPGAKMHGIWDSPAWSSLGEFTTTKGNLTFAFFIDWFNPLSNKIAGKKISYGAVMLCCLNLPPEVRYLPENVYFAGITPGPHEPSVTTVSNVLESIVDGLHPFWAGKSVRTHRSPGGRIIRVAVIPLQGDTPGLRKAGGQAGHSADQFCAFCTLTSSDVERLDFMTWPARSGADVRAAAFEWRAATTKVARNKIFKRTGVRWSELHRLDYRSHVRYTVLGVMHNWLEGVLQDHLRRIWGFGKDLPTCDDDTAPGTDAVQSSFGAAHPLSDEIAQLLADQALHSAAPVAGASQLLDASPMDICSEGDSSFVPDDESASESESDEDGDGEDDGLFPMDIVDEALGPTFDDTAVQLIRDCIADIILPTDIERPPVNLGEKAHGKLKADIFYTLFAVVLPMCLVEYWSTSTDPRDALLLDNFHDLVAATLIVGSYSVSPADADRYMYHYIRYRASKRTLFPRLRSRPNDHYAMHNGDQLKFWGPLAALSEFPYERLNGQFQSINTNGHIYEMDYTMLRQICRRGRLAAQISDGAVDPAVSSILLGREAPAAPSDKKLNPSEAARKLADGTRMPAAHYSLLLDHLNARGGHWVAVSDTIQPLSAHVLPPLASYIRTCKSNGRDYTKRALHQGQASIVFATADGAARYPGFVEEIFELPLHGVMRTFCVVAPHAGLSVEDEPKNPFLRFPGFQNAVFYAHSYPHIIVEPREILGRAAVRFRPAGTFGISQDICIVHALGRGRK